MDINIKIKKLNNDAMLPTYGTNFSAGADLYAYDSSLINPGETKFIGTSVAIEIPSGYVGLIYARSGLSCKSGLAPANKVGVIDSDYRGEIKVALYNQSKEVREIKKGDRIAQIVFTTYNKANFIEVGELDNSIRGEGGFGSTGKN